MGNRGVDLAELKARRAAAEAEHDRRALLTWAQALAAWIGSALEGDSDDAVISVPSTGERFVLTRRRVEEA